MAQTPSGESRLWAPTLVFRYPTPPCAARVGNGGLKLLKTSSHPSCPLGLCVGGKDCGADLHPPSGDSHPHFSLSFFSLPLSSGAGHWMPSLWVSKQGAVCGGAGFAPPLSILRGIPSAPCLLPPPLHLGPPLWALFSHLPPHFGTCPNAQHPALLPLTGNSGQPPPRSGDVAP